VTAVKCRLLGWWVDETKGYRLEDIQTRSLITSRDVRFVEDETPTELTIIEGDPPPVPIGELIKINTNDLSGRVSDAAGSDSSSVSLKREVCDDLGGICTLPNGDPSMVKLPHRERAGPNPG
jgi:hypothetical protein